MSPPVVRLAPWAEDDLPLLVRLNAPSNGICRRVGFALIAETDFEYPKGHWMRCNDWYLPIHQYT